jgi:hypothetical protein
MILPLPFHIIHQVLSAPHHTHPLVKELLFSTTQTVIPCHHPTNLNRSPYGVCLVHAKNNIMIPYTGGNREHKHDLNDKSDKLAGAFNKNPPIAIPGYSICLLHDGSTITTKLQAIMSMALHRKGFICYRGY